MARPDPHSHYDDTQPRTASLELQLVCDFDRKRLSGSVTLRFAQPVEGPLDLDSRALAIHGAENDAGLSVSFVVSEQSAILGQRLRLMLPPDTRAVMIRYQTSPEATALQWLEPEQTAGRRQPFLFSQCQAIHARTMVPCQDTPIVRVPYRAEITVPEGITPVMSAGPAGTREDLPGTTTFLFEMPQPIPPYLLALAAGDLVSRDLSPRARVWAEPETIEAAAWEFAGVEDQIRTAEALFGPYEWDRFDMLVLPPSFPYGGMENPRLTFLTPTLLSGDRSLVDVVAHELAHSWTGNLVTNATMDHFWLNEGFTVWAERRILETLHGADAAAIGWAIGQKGLDDAIRRFGPDSPLTRLRMDLAGVDPDDAYSQVPYEKGARFVVALERAVGRERFDAFIRAYIERFHFTSITTEEFLVFLEEKFPGLAAQVDAQTWLHGTGMPPGAPTFASPTIDALEELAGAFSSGRRPTDAEISAWSPQATLVYLQKLPRPLPEPDCAWLDAHLGLTGRGNHEILVEWLTIAATSGYATVFPKIREVLMRVGRMKYLRPLYGALAHHAETRALARSIFDKARTGYHPLSRRVIENVMGGYPAD